MTLAPGTREQVTPSIADIQAAVCARYGLPLIDMRSQRRSRDIAHPRQLAMYLARYLTPHSLAVIGRHFGDRDHSTVIYAVAEVENRIARTAGFKATVGQMKAQARRRASRRLASIA